MSLVLTPTVLRLSALVAASMSAGYLWRAAVEPGSTAASLSGVPPALRVEPADVSFNSLDLLRRAKVEEAAPAQPRQVGAPVRRKAKPEAHVRSAQFVSVTVTAPPAAPVSSRPSTSPTKGKTTKSRPRPKPKPKPPAPPALPAPPAPPPPPAAPVPPPAPAGPLPPPPARAETRPGKGNGDKNHVHTGPPGQQKEKSKKAN
jgi:hypothetical protein